MLDVSLQRISDSLVLGLNETGWGKTAPKAGGLGVHKDKAGMCVARIYLIYLGLEPGEDVSRHYFLYFRRRTR
jgi:hypothetical protein